VRVLVANIPLPSNRFLVDLNEAIACQSELLHSSDAFWSMHGEFDVVHLHFPEYLTYAIEQSYHTELTEKVLAEVRKRLAFWAERSVIVVTRHVLLPHDALTDSMWEKMYELVYSYSDGVVHFATASIHEFKQRYRQSRFFRGVEPIHVVIPHQNYASLPNDVSRDDARDKLDIPRDASVMLVFGAIRNNTERDLVLKTFRGIKQRRKVLLISRWREQLADVSWIRLKYWLRDLTRFYHRLHPQHRFGYDFVEERDTQLYLNAADILFIPRLRVLNSGNVTLGMTFGRVVVGPDSWDVGELLRSMRNPVFDPDNPASAIKAVEDGFSLAREGATGKANQELARSAWRVEECAGSYLRFFESVIDRRQTLINSHENSERISS
jgi:hypothetical protein